MLCHKPVYRTNVTGLKLVYFIGTPVENSKIVPNMIKGDDFFGFGGLPYHSLAGIHGVISTGNSPSLLQGISELCYYILFNRSFFE